MLNKKLKDNEFYFKIQILKNQGFLSKYKLNIFTV